MTIEEPTPSTEPKIKGAQVGVPPMLQVAKASDIRNPWLCLKCGAIMGSVYHEKVRQGLSLSRLILFRGAVLIHEQLPINFVFGKIDAGEIGCSRCGTIREFHPSPETVRYFTEKHHARRKNRNL